MPVKADVLVVGGGVVGRVAAIALAETGARVVVVDAARNAGSTANAGSLHVQMQSRFIRLYPDQAPNVERVLRFYKQAVACWSALQDALGPLDLVLKGGLMLAESAEQMAFLEKKARREEEKGLDVALLDRAGLDRIVPWIGRRIVGAELCRDEGKLDPLLANRRLLERCTALGVTIVRDRIAGLELSTHGVAAIGKTAAYRAQEVIVAAAWGTGSLVRGLGVEIPTAAEPLHMNITEACERRIEHLVQHAERSITLKQFRKGQIVIGGGWPATGRGDTETPAVRAESLLGNVALAARLAPAIGPLRVIRTWAGMNTIADGLSIIGRLPKAPRVVLAVPGDAGYTLGPAGGEDCRRHCPGPRAASGPGALQPGTFCSARRVTARDGPDGSPKPRRAVSTVVSTGILTVGTPTSIAPANTTFRSQVGAVIKVGPIPGSRPRRAPAFPAPVIQDPGNSRGGRLATGLAIPASGAFRTILSRFRAARLQGRPTRPQCRCSECGGIGPRMPQTTPCRSGTTAETDSPTFPDK